MGRGGAAVRGLPRGLLLLVRVAEVLRFALVGSTAVAAARRLGPLGRLLLGVRRCRTAAATVRWRCLPRLLLLRAVVPAASDPESSHVVERTRSGPFQYRRARVEGPFAAEL
ncbi:hypothetical protein GCM10010387_02870 [Streptomyces inusitatus]|uniref:Uncharacterized protein n=1 Tax=Streptomyces inusitatus TaxID=68221 RepID=A0A918PLX9_9ACTN|nr:hypothetical protein GCM10010387_02870 [Streptomyces inusitatus]